MFENVCFHFIKLYKLKQDVTDVTYKNINDAFNSKVVAGRNYQKRFKKFCSEDSTLKLKAIEN